MAANQRTRGSSLDGRPRELALKRAIGETLYDDALPQGPELALRIADGYGRETMGRGVGDAIEAWAARDFEGVSAWIQAQPADRRRNFRMMELVGAVAKESPDRARSLLTRIESPEGQRMAVERLVASWTPVDPAAALAWANAQTDPPLRDAARQSFIFFAPDSDQALAVLATFDAESVTTGLYEAIADKKFGEDPTATFAWMETVKDPIARRAVSRAIIRRWAQNDPMAALAWSREQPLGADDRSRLSMEIPRVVEHDPAAAMEWALSTDVLPQAMNNVRLAFQEWAERDPDAALRWAQNFRPDEGRFSLPSEPAERETLRKMLAGWREGLVNSLRGKTAIEWIQDAYFY